MDFFLCLVWSFNILGCCFILRMLYHDGYLGRFLLLVGTWLILAALLYLGAMWFGGFVASDGV